MAEEETTAVSEPTLEGLKESLGVVEETSTEETSVESEKEEQTTGETEEPTSEEEKEEQPPKEDVTKANKAFAELRVKAKEYEKLLSGVGELVGVQGQQDPETLVSALRQKVIEGQAKQQNIDPKILARLQNLETEKQQNERERIHRTALSGFQKIKDGFGLDDKALQKFADDLVADGLNPFEQVLDVHGLYITRNYESLLEKARAEGAAAEAERLSKAETHSTTPNDNVGQEESPPAKITTVSELEDFYKKQR